MIPKIIHWCWLSNDPYPEKIQKCLETWGVLKDYQIMKWDTTNFDVNSTEYTKDTFSRKLYAYTSDYIRLKALYEYGGFYIDSDIHMLRPFDELLHKKYVFFGHPEFIAGFVIGCEKHSPIIKKALDYFEENLLHKPFDTKVTFILEKTLWKVYKEEDVALLPLSLITDEGDPNSYCVHLDTGMWVERYYKLRGSQGVGLCAIIKNEHRYLEEWILHNLKVGFTDLYIYEDLESDSHEEITSKYPLVHLYKIADIPELRELKGLKRLNTLYNWFLKKAHDENLLNWCACFDADEFLEFAPNWDMPKLLSRFGGTLTLYIYWKNYNANGNIKQPKGSLKLNYKEQCSILPNDAIWSGKSIFNCHLTDHFGFKPPHCGENALKTNASYVTKENLSEIVYSKCWINHYFTKSFEDWLDKLYNRGCMTDLYRKLNQFFTMNPSMKLMDCLKAFGTNTLHLIWLGPNKLSIPYLKSYKKYLPGFNIKIWTEDNIDFPIDNLYFKDMMELGEYAKASDYLRFRILYEYGGMYVDTDVQFLKKLPEEFLYKPFCGIEAATGRVTSDLILYSVRPKLLIFKDVLDMYDLVTDYSSISDGKVLSTVLFKYGYPTKYLDKLYQLSKINIYPSFYFCPKNFITGKEVRSKWTITTHHYSRSWIKKL